MHKDLMTLHALHTNVSYHIVCSLTHYHHLKEYSKFQAYHNNWAAKLNISIIIDAALKTCFTQYHSH